MSVNPTFKHCLVLIKGAGDLASGVAYRLKRSGFPVVMTELPKPLMVRRTVCFGDVVYRQETCIEGMPARLVKTPTEARQLAYSDVIPVLVDPQAKTKTVWGQALAPGRIATPSSRPTGVTG